MRCLVLTLALLACLFSTQLDPSIQTHRCPVLSNSYKAPKWRGDRSEHRGRCPDWREVKLL